MSQGNQKHGNHCTKIRSPGRNTLSQHHMAACSPISVTSLPLMSIPHICWDMRNSPGLVVSRRAASAVGSSEKNSAGREESHGKRIQFLFWFIALCNYNNQRALLWCADIQVQADLFSCHTVKVVIASCSLLIGVCVQYLYVHACKHFIVQKWTRWGNECWCLQGASAVWNGYQPNMWL